MRVNRKDKGSCRDAKGTVHTKNKNVAIIYSPSCGSTFVDFLLLIFLLMNCFCPYEESQWVPKQNDMELY